ncbi:MAG: hypothetical protein Q8K78_11940 [Planctomycetaceae bacterium]|nr:hypothetical protein [Planctomycetaceae bacterium]
MTDPTPNNGHNPPIGDSGGNLAPGRQTTMMVARALSDQRYAIGPEQRAKLIEYLFGVVDSATASEREKLAAVKALLAADALNVQCERIAQLREQPAPTANTNVVVIQDDDWYGTRDALREKAQQYGLTESRLVAMIENNGDHPSVQDRIQGAIAADPAYLDYLRDKALGTLPKPSTPNPN